MMFKVFDALLPCHSYQLALSMLLSQPCIVPLSSLSFIPSIPGSQRLLCMAGGNTESTTSADYYKKGADDANSAIQSRVPDEARQAGEDAAAALKSALPDEPKQAAKDAVSSVKDALPGKPEEAAKDAASAAKDNIPEPPKDVPNPFSNFFGGKPLTCSGLGKHCLACLTSRVAVALGRHIPTVQRKPHICHSGTLLCDSDRAA